MSAIKFIYAPNGLPCRCHQSYFLIHQSCGTLFLLFVLIRYFFFVALTTFLLLFSPLFCLHLFHLLLLFFLLQFISESPLFILISFRSSVQTISSYLHLFSSSLHSLYFSSFILFSLINSSFPSSSSSSSCSFFSFTCLFTQALLRASEDEFKKSQDENEMKIANLSTLLNTGKIACADAMARSAQLNIMAQALTMTIAEKDSLLNKYVLNLLSFLSPVNSHLVSDSVCQMTCYQISLR